MKAFGYALLLCMVIFIVGCEKSPLKIVFHGRVTYKCDGSAVKGMEVLIHRYYDTGMQGSDEVGSATTDEEGKYVLETKVERTGSLQYYLLTTTQNINPQPPCSVGIAQVPAYTGDDNNRIVINASVPASLYINFHIKNVNPFDNADVFLGIQQRYDSTLYQVNQLGQLTGMSVDTIVVGNGIEQNPFLYKYSFIKNGITSEVDGSIASACFSQPSVDIFY